MSPINTTPPPTSYPLPRRLAFVLAATVFLCEFILMTLLPRLGLTLMGEAVGDAFLLTLLFIPAVYLFVYRPLADQVERGKRAEEAQEKLISELQEALTQVRRLTGLLPVCAWCKNIRDERGHWMEMEEYVSTHTDADFTHSICPECIRKNFPEHDS